MTDATQGPGTADKDTAALLARARAALEGATPEQRHKQFDTYQHRRIAQSLAALAVAVRLRAALKGGAA
jgi:hypothetical protein